MLYRDTQAKEKAGDYDKTDTPKLSHGEITNDYLIRLNLNEVNPILSEKKDVRLDSDRRLALYSYTHDTFSLLLVPMIEEKKEASGSMGNDAALACLSDYSPLLFRNFQQLSAQVPNPPIDKFSEQIVMSLRCPIGPESNVLEPDAELASRLTLEQPILSMVDMEVIKRTMYKGWRSKEIDITFPVKYGVKGLVPELDKICSEACTAALDGYQILVLSDRKANAENLPIPSLLAVGAIHQVLIRHRLRMKVAIVVETGEARVDHDFCVLLGFGADAICPYMVYETMFRLRNLGLLDKDLNNDQVYQGYRQGVERGIFKVMAKMRISTLHLYKRAQIFEVVGLSQDVVDMCFKNTVSRLGGATFEILAAEALKRHKSAYPTTGEVTYGDSKIWTFASGPFHWRAGGEQHINEPLAIANFQEVAEISSVHDALVKADDKVKDAVVDVQVKTESDVVEKEPWHQLTYHFLHQYGLLDRVFKMMDVKTKLIVAGLTKFDRLIMSRYVKLCPAGLETVQVCDVVEICRLLLREKIEFACCFPEFNKCTIHLPRNKCINNFEPSSTTGEENLKKIVKKVKNRQNFEVCRSVDGKFLIVRIGVGAIVKNY